MAVTFMSEIRLRGGKIIRGREWQFNKSDEMTFGELFSDIHGDCEDRVEITLSVKKADREPEQGVRAHLTQPLSLLKLQGANFVTFTILPLREDVVSVTDVSCAKSKSDALQALMQNARKIVLPAPLNYDKLTMKDQLYNDTLKLLSDAKVGFSPHVAEETGKAFVLHLRNFLWYLDPFWNSLESRSLKMPDFFNTLYEERRKGHSTFKMFNDYQMRKKTKPQISSTELAMHVDQSLEYLNTVWMSKPMWEPVRIPLQQLVVVSRKYLQYLEEKTNSMKALYSSSQPARTPVENGMCWTIDSCDSVIPDMADLDRDMRETKLYKPYFLNDATFFSHKNPDQRFKYLKKLQNTGLTVPVVVFKYSPFGGKFTFVLIWRLPDEPDERDDSQFSKITNQIAKQIPIYHTRSMKLEFQQHFSNWAKIPPYVFRAMYSFLTGDESKSGTAVSQAVDERMNQALLSDDPQLVIDLRENNVGRPQEFEPFWDALERVLQLEFPPAADDRRHSTHGNLPVTVSVRDLIEKVKDIEPSVKVPSETWIRFQFWPKNPHSHSALNYTGRFDIKYKVQARSIHKSHEDSHYCMALMKYAKSFAVLHQNDVFMYCMDDKHAVNVGEPEAPLASLDRGKRVLMYKGKESVALDHDFHRFKLTPSVLFVLDVPE